MSNLVMQRRMLGAPLWGLIVLLLGVAGTRGVAQSVPPRSLTMQDLTVPKERLPQGCALKVIEPARREAVATTGANRVMFRIVGPTASMQPIGVTANPWMGTDRRILAGLRQTIDGYADLRLPDAPPLTSRETSAMLMQFADGVEEGYAATYAQTGRPDLGVSAVKLAQPPDRLSDDVLPGGRRPQNARVVDMGSIRAALFGGGGECSVAIEAYLASLGK